MDSCKCLADKRKPFSTETGGNICLLCGLPISKEATKTTYETKEVDYSYTFLGIDPTNKKYWVFFAVVIAVGIFISSINSGSTDSKNTQDYLQTCPDGVKIPASSFCEDSKIVDDADDAWLSPDFNLWTDDSNVGWRWLKKNEYKCDADACWGMMIMAKEGCSNDLYVEIAILDKNDIQIGYSNDVVSSTLPMEKSKMIFNTYEDSADTARISKISCY